MESYEDLVNLSYGSKPKYTEILAGVPEDYANIKTLGDLLSINYKIISSREQLRNNLIRKLKTGDPIYPKIIGFEDDVLPSLNRAILSGHDIFLIGQMGQAKTRLVQIIASTLLSPIPVISQSITNDCPMDLPPKMLASLLDDKEIDDHDPAFYISPESAEKIRDNRLDTKISWIDGISRFKYVLATPDLSVKDLVGYIDAVKVAKKGVEMYKIDSYSPGKLMQAKHGIICIDELPVLDPRKQVALLSVLQEGRFTTGNYPVIFEPKTVFFATANPVDYTHSGKVIEPLYDRLKSHIHTHYPNTLDEEMLIILQEAQIPRSFVSSFLLYIIAKLVHKTRNSPQINQEKGVSVRLGIHSLELLVAESERSRAIHHNILPVPRPTDLHCLGQVAKFELAELDDTVANRDKVFDQLISESVKETCVELLPSLDEQTAISIKEEFSGKSFYVSQQTIWKDGTLSYQNQLSEFPTLQKLVHSTKNTLLCHQDELIKQTTKFNISTEAIVPPQDDSELFSILTELLLEYLCHTNPKILDKKEGSYVQA